MTKMHDRSQGLRKLAGLMGVAGISILIAFPGKAQQPGGVLNPNPSIFNEPPYNRSTTPAPSAPVTPPAPVPSPAVPAAPPTEATPGSASNNVVALAAANDSFKTLTAALKAAGLTETLSGTGPFTVFAPTDEAFAALPQDALQDLLKPENKELLTKILTYHVVPGKLESSQLKAGNIKSVEGGAIDVKVGSGNGVTVNDAKVVQADIQASNGVIHAIDKVILPPDL